jgi:hypothetical protein
MLHRVDVRRICPDVQQQLLELVRQVIREELARKPDAPAGALRTREAAAYMGLKRTKFLDELENDPILKAAEIRMGRARAWLREGLDRSLQARAAKATLPSSHELTPLQRLQPGLNEYPDGLRLALDPVLEPEVGDLLQGTTRSGH